MEEKTVNYYKVMTYFAIGYAFVIFTLNITLNGNSVNFTPSWIGYILLFFGLSQLNRDDLNILKILDIVLGVIDAVLWGLKLANNDVSNLFFDIVITIISAYFVYKLFTLIGDIAKENNSEYSDTIYRLRIINLVALILLNVFAISARFVNELVLFALLAGLIEIVSVIYSAFVLFKLRKEFKTV